MQEAKGVGVSDTQHPPQTHLGFSWAKRKLEANCFIMALGKLA